MFADFGQIPSKRIKGLIKGFTVSNIDGKNDII